MLMSLFSAISDVIRYCHCEFLFSEILGIANLGIMPMPATIGLIVLKRRGEEVTKGHKIYVVVSATFWFYFFPMLLLAAIFGE